MNLKTATVAALLAGLTPFVHAAEGSAARTPEPSRFYAGVDIGRSRGEASPSAQFFGQTIRAPEDEATGFKLRLGYQFSKYVAVEAAYVNFGTFEFNGIPYACPANIPGPCVYNLRSRITGPLANVVGSLPLGERWSLNARAGVLYAKTEAREVNPGLPASAGSSPDSNSAITYGVGVGFKLNERLTLEADWANYDQVGLSITMGGTARAFTEGTSSLASLGVRYRF